MLSKLATISKRLVGRLQTGAQVSNVIKKLTIYRSSQIFPSYLFRQYKKKRKEKKRKEKKRKEKKRKEKKRKEKKRKEYVGFISVKQFFQSKDMHLEVMNLED
jgi:hypothetical protein